MAQLQGHFALRYRHIAASAGELGYEIPVANLARPGLLLYGVAPMASIYDGVLRPTLSLSSRISLVRELPAGHGVAYGRTFITERPRAWPPSVSAMQTAGAAAFPAAGPASSSAGNTAPCWAA